MTKMENQLHAWTYSVCSLQPLSCCTCNVMVCQWACWGLCVWVLMCFSASPSLKVSVCTSTYAHLIICRCANTEMRLCDSGITCSAFCSFIDCVGNMHNKKWTVDVHLFICIYAKCTYLLHRLYLDKFEILSVDYCLKIEKTSVFSESRKVCYACGGQTVLPTYRNKGSELFMDIHRDVRGFYVGAIITALLSSCVTSPFYCVSLSLCLPPSWLYVCLASVWDLVHFIFYIFFLFFCIVFHFCLQAFLFLCLSSVSLNFLPFLSLWDHQIGSTSLT